MSNPYNFRADVRVKGDLAVDGATTTTGLVSAAGGVVAAPGGIRGAGFLASIPLTWETPGTDVTLYTVPTGYDGFVDWAEVVVTEAFDGTGAALSVEVVGGTNNGIINITDLSAAGPLPDDASGLGADLWSTGNTAPKRLGLAAGDVVRFTLAAGSGASAGALTLSLHGALKAS
jgi:hypothetical protein